MLLFVYYNYYYENNYSEQDKYINRIVLIVNIYDNLYNEKTETR